MLCRVVVSSWVLEPAGSIGSTKSLGFRFRRPVNDSTCWRKLSVTCVPLSILNILDSGGRSTHWRTSLLRRLRNGGYLCLPGGGGPHRLPRLAGTYADEFNTEVTVFEQSSHHSFLEETDEFMRRVGAFLADNS